MGTDRGSLSGWKDERIRGRIPRPLVPRGQLLNQRVRQGNHRRTARCLGRSELSLVDCFLDPKKPPLKTSPAQGEQFARTECADYEEAENQAVAVAEHCEHLPILIGR